MANGTFTINDESVMFYDTDSCEFILHIEINTVIGQASKNSLPACVFDVLML